MAIALLALFVALGGVGYAAMQIDGSQLVNRSVPGKKLKKGAVTGAEVAEATLGKVPAAHHADGAHHAVNATNALSAASAGTAGRLADRDFETINYSDKRDTADTAALPILEAGSLTLSARCTASGIAIDATTDRGGADLVVTTGGLTTAHKGDFSGTVTDVVPASKSASVTFQYHVSGSEPPKPQTEVVSGNFGEYQDADDNCVAFGHAEYTPINIHLR